MYLASTYVLRVLDTNRAIVPFRTGNNRKSMVATALIGVFAPNFSSGENSIKRERQSNKLENTSKLATGRDLATSKTRYYMDPVNWSVSLHQNKQRHLECLSVGRYIPIVPTLLKEPIIIVQLGRWMLGAESLSN